MVAHDVRRIGSSYVVYAGLGYDTTSPTRQLITDLTSTGIQVANGPISDRSTNQKIIKYKNINDCGKRHNGGTDVWWILAVWTWR